jgi:hypothetical protein
MAGSSHCDTLDYCEYCRSPDGRVGTFELWQRDGADSVELLNACERNSSSGCSPRSDPERMSGCVLLVMHLPRSLAVVDSKWSARGQLQLTGECTVSNPVVLAQRRRSRLTSSTIAAPIAIAATGFSLTNVDTLSSVSP